MTHDIDDRDKYILGGCVGDRWVAVLVLLGLCPSFGGGIGALAIPSDPRIDRGYLQVPTFSNIPVWLTLPTVGSGNAEQPYARAHHEVIETLRYFDAATAATRIDKPMLMAVARFDPAVANNLALSRMLDAKRVRHQLYVWDGRAHRASAR